MSELMGSLAANQSEPLALLMRELCSPMAQCCMRWDQQPGLLRGGSLLLTGRDTP